MPVSLRLNKELEDKVNQIAKKLNINKTEVIKRSLKKYLSEVAKTEPDSSYSIYHKFEKNIPGSGHGSLSIDHRKEVLKKIKGKEGQ